MARQFLSEVVTNISTINTATKTGAVDVVMVEQQDNNTFHSTAFHVRFGKIGAVWSAGQIIDIEINGREVDMKMVLDQRGLAFFPTEVTNPYVAGSGEAGGGTDGEPAPQPGSSHLQLDTAGLERLGLHLGSNTAVFSLTTQFQGTTRAECSVFLWRAGERVVVSDIDGTITRSDKRGMLLPWVGLADWAQAGCSHKPPALKLVG